MFSGRSSHDSRESKEINRTQMNRKNEVRGKKSKIKEHEEQKVPTVGPRDEEGKRERKEERVDLL